MCEAGEEKLGGGGNSMGLILDARSHYFLLSFQKQSLFILQLLSLFGPCLPE